jgi:hypothetical protein
MVIGVISLENDSVELDTLRLFSAFDLQCRVKNNGIVSTF